MLDFPSRFFLFYSYELTCIALKSIWMRKPMKEILNDSKLYSDKLMDSFDDTNE